MSQVLILDHCTVDPPQSTLDVFIHQILYKGIQHRKTTVNNIEPTILFLRQCDTAESSAV
jgi:hypothetical protein